MEFDFAAMLENHRRDRRRAWLLAIVVLVSGLALALLAWQLAPGDQLALWAGLLVAGLAVVPAIDALDRTDRIAALERLRGAWVQAAGGEASGEELDRLRRLIRATHGVASA